MLDAFRSQYLVEGGDPFVQRAIYNGGATTFAELAQDLEVAQSYARYANGNVVLDADGLPLDEAELAQFEADREAAQDGALSAEEFAERYQSLPLSPELEARQLALAERLDTHTWLTNLRQAA